MERIKIEIEYNDAIFEKEMIVTREEAQAHIHDLSHEQIHEKVLSGQKVCVLSHEEILEWVILI